MFYECLEKLHILKNYFISNVFSKWIVFVIYLNIFEAFDILDLSKN